MSTNDNANERLLIFNSHTESFQLVKVGCSVHNLNLVRDEEIFSSSVAAKVTNHIAKASTIDNFKKRKQKEKASSLQKAKTELKRMKRAEKIDAKNAVKEATVAQIDKSLSNELSVSSPSPSS